MILQIHAQSCRIFLCLIHIRNLVVKISSDQLKVLYIHLLFSKHSGHACLLAVLGIEPGTLCMSVCCRKAELHCSSALPSLLGVVCLHCKCSHSSVIVFFVLMNVLFGIKHSCQTLAIGNILSLVNMFLSGCLLDVSPSVITEYFVFGYTR